MTLGPLAAGVLAQAGRTPDAIAVVDGNRQLDYAGLTAASAALAEGLRRHGIGPGDAVAVCLPRSAELVCAMLGILRAGATVVPLDAQSPPERRRHILTDAGCAAVITGDGGLAGLPGQVRPLPVAGLLATEPVENPPLAEPIERDATADRPAIAFVFYTSGTTGRPKGVEVPDAGILRLARPSYLRLAEARRFGCLSNPAFDAISFEVWVPLLTGGCCVILDEATVAAPDRLAEALQDSRVDTMFITVALFNTVVDQVPHCFTGVRQLLVGGDQLNAALIRRWYRDNPDAATQLYNGYGPTETATFALSYPIPRDFDADLVPIGTPLPGTEAVLLTEDGRPAGDGETAELLIGGEAVAAGYRNLPAETKQRFVRLPELDGGRYYRTGDLVRRTGGLVSYLGRTDRQVKVRGFRIEPGELERQLTKHPAISQAYVCTRRTGTATELLAYLVPAGPLDYADYERHLAATLPSYMRPHQAYLLDALPLTPNGKVDQDALLGRDDPPWRGNAGSETESSKTSGWQHEVLELAADVLGVAGLRPSDSWIAAGGDSLKALRLRYQARQRWGSELSAGLVLTSTLGELAEAIAAGRDSGDSPYPVPAAPSGARSAPATSEQQRLWLLQQQDPESVAYNVGLAFRLTGTLQLPALRQALRELVVRYPALRTGFVPAAEGLRQKVGEPYDPWFEPVGNGDWRAVAERALAEPFDLAEPRMLQACWLADEQADEQAGDRTGSGVLLLRLHHIAVDGWSVTLLLQALSDSYAAALAGTEPNRSAENRTPLGYADGPAANRTPLDYAAWQADWFGQPAYATQRAELREHYAGLEPVSAPLIPAAGTESSGRLLHTRLTGDQRAALDRIGAELGLTRFQLLLGVFACGVYGVTGRDRPLIASPVANRPVAGFEASVGMFANTVLLPLRLDPAEELRAQLGRHGRASKAVLDRQEVALADVLADHRFAEAQLTGPLFDFLFVLENTDYSTLALPGCTSRPEWLTPAGAKCALTLTVVESGEALDCLWEYAADYLDEPAVAALAALFDQGLAWLVEGRTATLAELVAGYRAGLAEPGRGPAATLDYATVAEGFARQVRSSPDAPALRSGGRTVSYAQLDGYAGALAAELLANYPVPADGRPCCVALHLEASVEHVVALLALARLNLTIVPLDPEYPPAQLQHILGQINPLCVLLPPDSRATVDTGSLPRHPVRLRTPATPVPVEPAPDGTIRRPLYTLFTSGSTGTPKGVQVSDRLLCNLLQWQRTDGGLAPDAVTQQFSMLSFDVSFQEIFSTLCGGGCLHLVQPGWRQDAPALLEQLDSAGIERIFMPYVALHLLAEHAVLLGRFPRKLREVITAGEQLLCTQAIRDWFAGLPGARLFNHYGPTETHVVSALCLDGDPAGWPLHPAIGEPVANTWLRVVDAADQPVPPDCPGQLLIGGPLVAPCYLDDPDLNQARFVELAEPSGLPEAGWFFRTGDQARFDRQGLLHFLGRDDSQVKVSGHRLELGEVEAALLRHPAITGAVVVRDGNQLVACLQCRGTTPTLTELTEHLAPLLPAYVRIGRFRRLAELPRTASGKLDRRRMLIAPGEEIRPHGAGAGVTAREAQLAELFEAVVGTPIEVDQRFFDAGASSLGLMRLHLRLTAELRASLTIADLFEHVTIRRLARFLDGPAGPTGVTAQLRQPSDTPSDNISRTMDEPIAVIGMAVRLPGADDLAGFWDLVRTGRRGIEHFDAADGTEGWVGARSQLAGLLAFDPGHFGISRQEARLMDPQQRHLLMCAVQALAHAGIARPDELPARRVGLVASCGENTYFQSMLREADPAQLPDSFQLALHSDKDFLATKVAYHLGLTGPALTVQSACSSSLVGVHLAAGMLRQGDSEVMLVGGVLVDPLLSGGYRYRPQHIFSPDGHCRPFSDDAGGTIGGSGVGVVVLKPLRLARADGDTVYSVVTGSAINNDGSAKLSYGAPALAGQREVIRAALRRSGRGSDELGYVEAHGTGTRLGDPVEVGALRQAYDLTSSARCALASVKSQIGHLGAAAGVVGLIRATFAVHHGLIPPNVDFARLNPELGPDPAPFYIPTEARPWPAGRPRVAAVSSFGIGGTNSHLVLEAPELSSVAVRNSEQSPRRPVDIPHLTAAGSEPVSLLMLSSSSAGALRADAERIADYLAEHPDRYPQVLRHLQAGRPAYRWRMAAYCPDPAAAVSWLSSAAAVLIPAGTDDELDGSQPAGGSTAPDRITALAAAWLGGSAIRWPAGPAQPPWDFPPPSFELADYDLPRHAPDVPAVERLAADRWLHQPHWARWRRAGAARAVRTSRLLVVLTAEPLPPDAVRPWSASHARVVRVSAGPAFAALGEDAYQVDPADPASLARLLRELTPTGGIDWVHALPLAVTGPVGAGSVDQARWACLDTPAALLQALAEQPVAGLRIWWLSGQAQPVDGAVGRPEAGLLAGICEVGPQEQAVAGCWLDLPDADLAGWAAPLAGLLSAAGAVPRRLALRQGYWWQQAVLPVAEAEPAPAEQPAGGLMVDGGSYLVLGGTGGIGSSIASWLLAQAGCRLLLLAREPKLPPALAQWADRIELVPADLASEPVQAVLDRLAGRLSRLDGVVHAAGAAAGSLIARRDPAAMRQAGAAKLTGCLLVEGLIQRYQPAFAAYCSSMSALFGGIGQLDYAAGNGMLDGFACYRGQPAETTVRLGIDWDVWAEVGMAQAAQQALRDDARHQAHLAVGLSVAEGQRVFAQALELQLPRLLVSTTDLEQAGSFYAPPADDASRHPDAHRNADAHRHAEASRHIPELPGPVGSVAEQLADCLCRWLGVDELDPAASLYDLGADSLVLLDLIGEIKQRFGVDIELARLSHRASLAEVLAQYQAITGTTSVAEPAPAHPSADQAEQAAPADQANHPEHPAGAELVRLDVWQHGTGSDLLCLVHPVGGDIQAYRSLVSLLDPGLTVCLIADPALYRPELPPWSLADRARHYAEALHARFPRAEWRWRLAGWSFGAWVALAMAAEGEAAGQPVAGLYLLDPPPPGSGPALQSYDEEQLRTVFELELDQNQQNGQRPGNDEAAAYAERLVRCCRANLASMVGYQLPGLTETPAELWLAGRPVPGLPQHGSPDERQQLWQALLPGLAGCHLIDTTHDGIVRLPAVRDIASVVNAASRPVFS
ncbi:amino acid adenylation domain-containing protein [Jatrophihabitans sp.]|uniref:amino acid adenylation domain-containing protein n=1 Tax=Jatrophihabitans sp. TaxID=1932789 RepID=UPI002CF7B216|nr:amino acid adenylation domain-containing protein [Jatrophihabitans sp.]